MATINHGSGADIIVPSNNGTTYRGLAGDDTYIISNSIAANAEVTIVDTSGANKIQLVDGLSVKSSKFAADAVQLTLSNGAVVTINGASNFTFDVGGNATTGTSGSSNSLAEFASAMGVASLPTSGSTSGSSDITIANNGVSGSAAPTFTVTKSGTSVDEGEAITFTITASSAVSADTSFSWTVIGDTNGSTVDAAGSADVDILSGTATIASGSTSTTFDVSATSDAIVEGIEGIKVSVFDADAKALSSSNLLINNSGSSATSQSFTLSAGVNEFVGGSGNDSFDGSTTANSLNDFDNLDGAGGTDTVTSKTTTTDGGSITPQLNNIEKISITNTNTDTANSAADTYTVNLSESTSINSLANVTSNDDVSFTNVTNVAHLELKTAVGLTTVEYDLAALAGSDDNMTVTVRGTNGTNVTIDDDNPLNSSVLETVTINSQSVANTLATFDTSTVNTTKLVINGDKKLTLSAALDADIVTVDASASTGGIDLDAGAAATAFTVMGGAGADTLSDTTANTNLNFSGGAGNDLLETGADWSGYDVFDGGDGIDTLSTTASFEPTGTGATSGSTILGGLSNVERLKLVGDGLTASFDSNTSINYVDISEANNQIVNLNDGLTQAMTVNMAGDTAALDKIVNAANVDLTIIASPDDIDGNTATKTTITGGLGSDTIALNNDGTNVSTSTITLAGTADSVTGVDKITFTRVLAGADPIVTTGDYDNNSAIGTDTLTIDGSNLIASEKLTVNGTSSKTTLIITGGAAGDALTGASLTPDTIHGGAGNDTIDGVDGADVIDGGPGNDSITSGEGIDHIKGGAGNDTINMENDLQLTDTVDAGEGTDTLVLGADLASTTVAAGLSNFEKVSLGSTVDVTAAGSLGGAQTFLLSDASQNKLTLSTGWTGDTTVVLTTDSTNNDSVVNSANVNLTVLGNSADIDTNTTLTGGTGTDTLNITADGDGTGSVLANVTNFEAINVVDSATAGTDIKITPNLTTVKLQTIDGSALDGSTQNDETLHVAGDGAAGKLHATGGGGKDSLYGGGANDTLIGNGGIDSINGNGGLDELHGGDGNDIFLIDLKSEHVTALGYDTIDGGAGTDQVKFNVAMNMTAAQLATISNTETWTITPGSDFTISDTVLTNNPGVKFQIAGNGTLSGGEDTAGAALMTEAINFTSTAAGDLKLIGSSGDDTFTFDNTASLTADDTIDGNAGSDTIRLVNNTVLTSTDGEATAATFDADVKGIEKILIVDAADGDYGGDVTINITDGYTDTSLTIDASTLDVDPTNSATGEILTVNNNDTNVKLTVLGGAGRDDFNGNGGAESVQGNGAEDNLSGGGGNDTLEGGAGADVLEGGAGTDSIVGGDGNDTVNVTTFGDFKTAGGSETVDGGAGTDTLAFAANAELVLTAPEVSKLYSIEKITIATQGNAATMTFGNETFTNLGNDSLQITANTGAAATKIDGSAVSNGAFVIIMEATAADSNDTLIGGSGDDIFRVVSTAEMTSSDVITGGAGTDTIQMDVSAAAATGDFDFNNVTGVEQITAYVNPLTGLDAGAVDIQIAKHGTAALNTGAFTVDMSNMTQNTVKFNVTNSVTDVKKDFTVTGGAKKDSLYGSGGNDVIDGGGVLVGDSITGGAGNDSLTGQAGADTIGGGTGNDTINSNGGADSLTGGAGNDVINAGDGIDNIDGEGGQDTITTGVGNDTVLYDAAADSTGANKDVITDFTQSTINAVTGDTVTAGDNISINFGTLADNKIFTLSDKGDVENAGLAGAAIDGVLGSFIFADDTSTIYLDFNGDGLLNASDLQITVTGLTSFHSNDINAIVTMGDNGEAGTGGNGDDSITGGSGADTLTGNYGNDTLSGAGGADSLYGNGGNDTLTDAAGASSLSGGAGDDVLTGGAGIDSMTGGTGDDIFKLLEDANADRDVVTDFEDAGAVVGDTIQLSAGETTDGTAAGAAPVVHIQTADATAGADLTLSGGVTTATADIVILPYANQANATLSATDNGTELLKLITAANEATATGITASANTDQTYFVAYDGGKAYIYIGDSDAVGTANDDIDAGEFIVVAVLDGVTAGSLVAADFAVLAT